jgi:hypothetical protein
MKRVNDISYVKNNAGSPLTPLKNGDVLSIGSVFLFNAKNAATFTDMPVIDNNKNVKNNLRIIWLAVNPNSNKKDLAIKYIELFTKNIQPNNPMNMLNKNINNEKGINQIWIDSYKKIMENSKSAFELDIYNSIKTILEDFYVNKISSDDSCKRINEKVKMIINE